MNKIYVGIARQQENHTLVGLHIDKDKVMIHSIKSILDIKIKEHRLGHICVTLQLPSKVQWSLDN